MERKTATRMPVANRDRPLHGGIGKFAFPTQSLYIEGLPETQAEGYGKGQTAMNAK